MSWRDAFIDRLFAMDVRDLDIDGAYRLKHDHLPPAIFKFRNVSDLSLANLRDSTVWLADPKALNDPYDCAHFINQAALESNILRAPPPDLADKLPAPRKDEILEALSASEDPTSTLVDVLLPKESPTARAGIKQALAEALGTLHSDVMESYSNRIKDAFKLCSFSERVDSPVMWAHYADNHKGFCIEYDVASLKSDDYRARFLYPVIYSDQVFDATELIALGVDDARFNNLRYCLAALIKSNDWSYEKEWRLVFIAGVIKAAQTFEMPLPRKVYLGSIIKPDHQKQVVEICDALGIEVMKMRHAQSQFKMEAVSLDVADRKRFVPRR